MHSSTMGGDAVPRFKRTDLFVPLAFAVLSIIGFLLADVSLGFMGRELTFRFIANGMTVLALLIPIYAGMGLNFALVLGVIASQSAVIWVCDRMVTGVPGVLLTVTVTLILSVAIGNMVGWMLNKTKGKEMITSIVIGFVGSSIYQLVFMVLYGRVIIPKNKEILLSNGFGVRNMVDLYDYKVLIDSIPWFPVVATILCAGVIAYIMDTPFGNKLRAVGEDMAIAESRGIDVDRVRQTAIVCSTVIAAIGHLLYMFSMGNVNVYTGHLNLDVFACAALLVGGATLRRASIWNAFAGILLFHTLFIVSPLAAKNTFENIAIGEYFRSFMAYGVIVMAFIFNLKNKEV